MEQEIIEIAFRVLSKSKIFVNNLISSKQTTFNYISKITLKEIILDALDDDNKLFPFLEA
jgi:hypothetical protein